MIEKNLSGYKSLFTEYSELRMQENRMEAVYLVNGNLMGNVKLVKNGISARVYKNGVWGFASHPEFSDESVKSVIQSATNNALFMDNKTGQPPSELPGVPVRLEKDFSTQRRRLSQAELIQFAGEIDAYLKDGFKNITSRKVAIQNLDMEKSLVTSDNSSAYAMIPRSIIYVFLSTEKDGTPVELFEAFGWLGQFEDVFREPSDLFPRIDKLHDDLMKKREGIYAEAGVKECILDSRLAGMLAHEAVGHTTEADFVLGGSVAAEMMNEQVASPLFTLIDYANTAMGETCPIPVYVDDEGIEAKDVVIIEEGILKNYMHNKDSARRLKAAPTGNARAYEFSDEPLIRMRNTAIMPGRDRLEDMIASIEDGYYLVDTGNGQADSTGEFTFGINQGYEIKKGKLEKAILDTTISGVAFDMLKTVSMVSDEMYWTCSGFCGKKQMIPVGMGGPAIKCRVMIGGR
ncbi:MAG: TldD/PmbA family protein [Spirochaetales bacterium]|nr:TldD/PmbA family protein [Spirochaetales bacterium]